MNIIVCYKIVPDEQDAVVASDRTLSFERAALKIGDYDLNAIEAGACLASEHEAKLICATVGDSRVEDNKLKKGVLARGPEELYALKDDSLASAKSSLTARALASLVNHIGAYDVVLCGEGSADLYSQQVGIQLGALLGIPAINGVTDIEIDGGVARVKRAVGSQIEALEVSLPAIISVAADMNVPRIPSMKDILGAGKKPATILSSEEVGLSDFSEQLETVSTLAPQQKDRACTIFEGNDADTIKEFLDAIKIQA